MKSGWVNNSYVQHEDFEELYLRKSAKAIRMADGTALILSQTIQIARVEAKKPKTGSLRRLIQEIDKLTDGNLPIYIENMFNKEATAGILSSDLGFQEVDKDKGYASCLLRLPQL